MMLLVDTNIIIDFWKNPTEETKTVFENNDVYTCGVVVAELLHGAASEKDLNNIKSAMTAFPMLHIENAEWMALGELLYKLRKSGLSVPFQDAIITCLALRHNATVWTRDKHFKLMKEIVADLNLYDETNVHDD